jgi:pimeloyl-ACP methyl ester carboxylesterase
MRRLLAALVLAGLLATASAHAATLPLGVKTVKVRGITTAYRQSGTGPPLLLINGSGATLDTWDPKLLGLLGATRTVTVFDPRGFGNSTDVARNHLTIEQMADDAAALAKKLGLGRPDVLGWSMGGFIAQELAIRHPKSVRRLVLASTDAGSARTKRASAKALAIDQRSNRGEATLDEILDLLFPKPARTAGDEWFGRLATQPGGCCELYTKKAGQAQVDAQDRWYEKGQGARDDLKKIKAPTLIGAGKLDRDVPFANAGVLKRGIKGATLVSYADAGHAFLIQHADEFSARVQAFLR